MEMERKYLTFLVGVLVNQGNELFNLVINFLLHFYFTALYLYDTHTHTRARGKREKTHNDIKTKHLFFCSINKSIEI